MTLFDLNQHDISPASFRRGAGLLIAAAALAGSDLHAEISGPEQATADFAFTLTWSHATETTKLEDLSNNSVHTGASATFAKSAGTYEFAEIYCFEIPPNPFVDVGEACVTVDTHTVTVAGTPSVTEAPHLQAGYEYTLRSGDFDGNDRTDVLVDRTTAGAVDGSFQTVIADAGRGRRVRPQGAHRAGTGDRADVRGERRPVAGPGRLQLRRLRGPDRHRPRVDRRRRRGLPRVRPGSRRGSAPLATTAMDGAFHQFFDDLGDPSTTRPTGAGTST